jgi:5-(carboxyamino)imidazole ribonucleotide synthase
VIAPGAWLGVLGGGQLGGFFAMAAKALGYRVMVLDPDTNAPAARVADQHLCADFANPLALETLASQCAAATIEFEGVPAASLDYLSGKCPIAPSAANVATTQDRIVEKALLSKVVGVVPYTEIRCAADIERASADLFPAILKTARMGYDGRGQYVVADAAAACAAFERIGGVACVLEKRVELARELSVVVARDAQGKLATYAVAENRHVNGILDVSIVPARVSTPVARAAVDAAIAVVEALDYTGVMCLELFELADGRLVANEVAPRPHNSGHWTLDAAATSQFEQQVRVLAGLPLGDTRQRAAAAMVNLLGDLWACGEPDFTAVLRDPAAKLWLYGKAQARSGRKMGHFTCVDAAANAALARAEALRCAVAEQFPAASPCGAPAAAADGRGRLPAHGHEWIR